MKKCSLVLGIMLFLTGMTFLHGQDNPLPPVTRTYAITNATIVTQPGEVIEEGVLLIKNGLIEAVGKDVEVPYDAKVIKADSMFVYAGFIDGLSHAGLIKEKQESEGRGQRRQLPDGVDPGDPPVALAGIQPQRRVSEMLDPKERDLTSMRELGFTAVHVVPEDGMLPGCGAIILLAGDTPESMILRDQTSLYSQLSGARGVYPATVIGVMSKYRELYMQADQAMQHETRYADNPGGMARPTYDKELEALYPVIKGDLPVFFKAEDIKSAYRVYALQEDLDFPLVLAGLREGWHIADKIKSDGTPVFLSLRLPKAQDAKKDKGENKGDKAAEKEEEKEVDEEAAKLEARRAEYMKKYESQAAFFSEKEIPFGFASSGASTKNIRADLRRMIENGLNEDAALAALTTNPAKLLGVDKMMGTVEKGKIANIVITDKPYFEEKSTVRYVMVDGNLFTYDKSKTAKKSSDTGAVTVIAGTWNFEVNVPNQPMKGTMTLIDNNGVLEGTVLNPRTKEENTIEEGEVKGNKIRFTTRFVGDGQPITLKWELEVNGDNFEGTIDSGEFGNFDISGDRTGPGGGR